MRCYHCRKKVPKETKVCPYCGNKARSGKGLIKTLIILICIALLAIGSIVARFLLLPDNNNDNNVNEAPPVTETAAPIVPQINYGGIDTSGTPQLWLSISRSEDIVAGKQATVGFTVTAPTGESGVTIVNETDKSELVRLDQKSITEDGQAQFTGTYTFTMPEAAFIEVRAYTADKFSQTGYIRVRSGFSEEDNEKFRDVMTDFGDYMNSLDAEYMTDTELLDAAEAWLKANNEVEEVRRDGESVHFTTKSGLSSYYTTERPSRLKLGGEASATDSYKTDTQAVEYYDRWTENRNALNQNGGISYLPADITITNNNTIMLRPTYYAEDGFDLDFIDGMLNMARSSEKLSGGSVRDVRGPFDVMRAIEGGELSSYGTIYIGAHGNCTNNYLLCVLDTTNKSEWERFQREYSGLMEPYSNGGYRDGSWDIIYYEYSDQTYDGFSQTVKYETHYQALLSARYIMDRYQSAKFDNAAIFMVSCHGTEDEKLNKFWIDHGAQCVIGSPEDVYFVIWERMADTVLKTMYESQDNESGKLSKAWDMGVQNDICSVTHSGNLSIGTEEYWSYYINSNKGSRGTSLDGFADKMINGYIVDQGMIEEYMRAIYPDYHDFRVQKIYTQNENGRKAGSFDYTATLSNRMLKITGASGDFTFGGKGSLTGTVHTGTVTKKIHSDGTSDTSVSNEKALPYANITAMRFLNQSFVNKRESDYKDETVADANGSFVLENIDWGHYIIDSDFSSLSDESSIILTKDSAGGEIFVPSGESSFSGYAEGYTDNGTEVINGAEITLKPAEGNRASYNARSDGSGYFKIDNISAGQYELCIMSEGYEAYVRSITISTGCIYEYDKGCFVLEKGDSVKDIVLVLDVSGSMEGRPIEAVKDAAARFANTIIGGDNSENRVAVVTYSDKAENICGFTKYAGSVTEKTSQIRAGGGTNMEAALVTAQNMLERTGSRRKYIVLMSDGMPNQGKTDKALVSYADEIKNDGTVIFTLGYFSNLSSGERTGAYDLMRSIASEGYHYEVTSTADLSDFFDDMAKQLSGVNYMVVEARCPVDVTVTYNGETLSSAPDKLCTRTSFGTLMFDGDERDPAKVLRLQEGADYDIRIEGTGEGTMDYYLRLPDSEGDYTDKRSFTGIAVSDSFSASTVANASDHTDLNLDFDGDGRTDRILRAQTNGEGEEYVPPRNWMPFILIASGITAALIILLVIVIKLRGRRKRRKEEAEAISAGSAMPPPPYRPDTVGVRPPSPPAPRPSTPAESRLKPPKTILSSDGELPAAAEKPPETKAEAEDINTGLESEASETAARWNKPGGFCIHCGARLDSGEKFCTNCGKEIE